MPVNHRFVNPVQNIPYAGARPSDWNASHVIDSISAPDNAPSLYNSIFNFQRTVTGNNVTEAAMFVQAYRNAGGSGSYAMAGLVGSIDIIAPAAVGGHVAGVLGYVAPTDTTAGSKSNLWIGTEGHAHATIAGTLYYGVVGTTSLENATSNSGTTALGVLAEVDVQGGTSTGAVAIGSISRVKGAGYASGINAVFGQGTVAGENYPASFRGFSSKTGNNGEAKIDISIVDFGASGALAYFDATDVRVALGVFFKLADQSAAQFVVQDSAGNNLIAVDANGSIVLQHAALATTATAGFTYIPTCAGTPTGVPGTQTGTVAMLYDTTANKIWVYNGSWRGVVVA